MAYKPFFKEWEDSKKVVYLHCIITMALVFLFMGIYINIPSESQRANVYQVMLLWAGVIAGIDALNEKNWIFAWAGWGDQKRAIPAFITGIAIMFVIVSTKTLAISAPLAVTAVASLSFVYTVVAAPYIEEKFFRGMTLFTSIQIFRGNDIPYYDIFAVILNAGLFALFHGFAYNWAIGGLVAAFLFSIFACIGNQLCKSGAFSFGAHLVNNLLVFIR